MGTDGVVTEAKRVKWNVLNLNAISHIPGCLSPLDGVAEVLSLPATPTNLEANLPSCDAYLAGLGVRLTRDLILRCPRLRVVATASTGVDHLDVACLAERGIPLISLKDETDFLDGITSTAEMAWALLLAVVRKLPWSFEAAKRGEWARDRYRGAQLSGLTLGVLGYGRLGRMTAEYGKAFRMRVLACDIRDVALSDGVARADFATLLRESDVLSVHIHLTPENTGLIGRDAFSRMKPGAILINTSRGAIVDEGALLDVLASGRLAGAGLDVIHGEWEPDLREHPLLRYARAHENLVISPHTGGVTVQAQRMALTFTARKLADFLNHLPH
jgi:D-3-phosphoglycerate dehydrogenase